LHEFRDELRLPLVLVCPAPFLFGLFSLFLPPTMCFLSVLSVFLDSCRHNFEADDNFFPAILQSLALSVRP